MEPLSAEGGKAGRRCVRHKPLFIVAGVVCAVILLIIVAIIVALVVVFAARGGPDLIDTYTAEIEVVQTITTTGLVHRFYDTMYSDLSHDPQRRAFVQRQSYAQYLNHTEKSVSVGALSTTTFSFLDRVICITTTAGKMMPFGYNRLNAKMKWKHPCPSNPDVMCDVFSVAIGVQNITTYVLPSTSSSKKGVPSAVLEINGETETLNIFRSIEQRAPDDAVFEVMHGSECYPATGSQTSATEMTTTNHRGDFIPNERANRLINSDAPIGGETWTAVNYPQFDGMTYADFMKTLVQQPSKFRPTGILPAENWNAAPLKRHRAAKDIPATWDAAIQWPRCSASVNYVRNQGTCGSCWAFAMAATYQDRYCIKFPNASIVTMSPQHAVDCIGTNGCQGFVSDVGWLSMIDKGITSEECEPYAVKAQVCPATCKDGSVPRLFKVSSVSSPFAKGDRAETVRLIQEELMANGPISVSMFVYSDFSKYQSGVYIRGKGSFQGGHAVRLVGWGEEGGVPFWKVANSWSDSWGEKGFFRIRRGTNECGIEDRAIAGIPVF